MLIDNFFKEVETEIQSIKGVDERSIIFRVGDKHYLHICSDIKYPLTNSELLYDNLLFEIKINDKLMAIKGIDNPFFVSSKNEKMLVKEIRGVTAPIFVTTGTIVELRPKEITFENLKFLYKYFFGLDAGVGYIYSVLISSDFEKIYQEVMTFPTKYVLLDKKERI
jgi:hypothetical protein